MNTPYTAILFAAQVGGGQGLTHSIHVQTEDVCDIYRKLLDTSGVSDDEVDTILLMQNSEDGPVAFKHWRAESGDFQLCMSTTTAQVAINEEQNDGSLEDGLE